jgi:hypothetical protein
MTSAHLETYWELRLSRCAKALEANNFAVYRAENPAEAQDLILKTILPETRPQSVSWGDSETLHATGVLELIRQDPSIKLIETFIPGVPREELIEKRRQALLTDLFFTGSNAISECGKLVNLDMIGNRTAGITFGPRNVVICVGRNKVVPNLEAGMERVRHYAAPLNAIRHEGLKTPCRKTGLCMDCKSPDRICNVWTISQKSYPKHRIKVILINQDLGL